MSTPTSSECPRYFVEVIKCTGFSCLINNSSAAAFNHGRIVELLLENGADLEAKDTLWMTPFLIAVTHGANQSVKVLLDHGAEITATDASLNSCLHLAIMYRKPEIVRILTERDTDKVLLLKDKDLQTVFHLAAGLEDSKVFVLHLFSKNYD